MSARPSRHEVVIFRIGLAGSLLGIVAGLTQAAVGDRIPQWSGAKQAPVALGLLTVALSLIAALGAVLQRRSGLSTGARAACASAMIVPGLLCLTTVGRLWFVPAVLLLPAGVLTIRSWRATAAALAADWLRVLLSMVGAGELLMAAGAGPALLVVGAVGGTALITAAWLRTRHRTLIWGLVALGTVPFAALAWTAVVPLVLAAEAIGVAALLQRRARPDRGARAGGRPA